MRMRFLILTVVLSGTLAATIVAKGTTVRLTISGGGLASPMEITGKEIVFANPWGDQLVQSWELLPPPGAAPRYEVAIYDELPNRQVKKMYVVEYIPNPNGRGVIHLPGEGEPFYRLNISTIFRGAEDGGWFPASDEWERIVGARVR